MKLPAKMEYASKAILELSLRYKADTPVQISVIAKAQKIPQNFLLQLLIRLKNAGLVNSSRGVAGGYFLARRPSAITLVDVVRAIDDSIVEAPRRLETKGSPDPGEVITQVWSEINTEVIRRLEDVTFDVLASRVKNEQFNYNI